VHDRSQEWRADGLPFDAPRDAGPGWGSDGGGYGRAPDDDGGTGGGTGGSETGGGAPVALSADPKAPFGAAAAAATSAVDAPRVQLLLGRRVEAKKKRDYGRADAIRLHVERERERER